MKPERSHHITDLAILIGLSGLTAWYLWDSYTASSHVFNLILVLPLSLVILVLCSISFLRELSNPSPVDDKLESYASVVPVIALFSAYVLSLRWLGFDLGTFLFVFLFLILHGEKRWHWACAYSLVFAGLVSLFFSMMLPYPMPMLFFPTEF